MTETFFDFRPFPVVETERLVLREIVPSDVQDVFAFRSDAEEQRHNDPPCQHVSEAEELITRLARDFADGAAVQWGLTRKADGRVEGLLGYNYWNRPHRRAGVGYDLARRLWGQGLMSEALGAVVEFGSERMRLNRIEAHTNTENVRSVRMLRRMGFLQEGTLHDQFYEGGAFHDVSLFVLLARDRARHSR